MRRNLHQRIVDPDKNMIYTTFLRALNSVGESGNAGIQ